LAETKKGGLVNTVHMTQATTGEAFARLQKERERLEAASGKSSEYKAFEKKRAKRSERRVVRKFMQHVADDSPWSEVPIAARNQWVKLGWTEDTWDADEVAPSDDKLWSDLSHEERQAARLLGYHQNTWDEWEDLSDEARHDWETLGWNAENWEEEGTVESDEQAWGNLTDKEREAALHLG
jgi:hypothetical protein